MIINDEEGKLKLIKGTNLEDNDIFIIYEKQIKSHAYDEATEKLQLILNEKIDSLKDQFLVQLNEFVASENQNKKEYYSQHSVDVHGLKKINNFDMFYFVMYSNYIDKFYCDQSEKEEKKIYYISEYKESLTKDGEVDINITFEIANIKTTFQKVVEVGKVVGAASLVFLPVPGLGQYQFIKLVAQNLIKFFSVYDSFIKVTNICYNQDFMNANQNLYKETLNHVSYALGQAIDKAIHKKFEGYSKNFARKLLNTYAFEICTIYQSVSGLYKTGNDLLQLSQTIIKPPKLTPYNNKTMRDLLLKKETNGNAKDIRQLDRVEAGISLNNPKQEYKAGKNALENELIKWGAVKGKDKEAKKRAARKLISNYVLKVQAIDISLSSLKAVKNVKKFYGDVPVVLKNFKAFKSYITSDSEEKDNKTSNEKDTENYCYEVKINVIEKNTQTQDTENYTITLTKDKVREYMMHSLSMEPTLSEKKPYFILEGLNLINDNGEEEIKLLNLIDLSKNGYKKINGEDKKLDQLDFEIKRFRISPEKEMETVFLENMKIISYEEVFNSEGDTFKLLIKPCWDNMSSVDIQNK